MTILLVTNRLDYDTDLVAVELYKRGLDYVRFNTEDLTTKVHVSWLLTDRAKSYFDFNGRRVLFDQVSSIWYHCPVDPLPSTEIVAASARQFAASESLASLENAWHSLNCWWVSHPDKLRVASLKIRQLELAREIGFNVPETLVTNIPHDAQSFLSAWNGRTVFKRLLSEAVQDHDGIKEILTSRIEPEHWALLYQVEYAPCQFQQLIEKAAEIRVTVIGQKVFAVAIALPQSASHADLKKETVSQLPHTPTALPAEIENKCRQLVLNLGLQFGCIDLIQTPTGEYYFLEINPMGQWAWIELLTGLPLTEAIADLLASPPGSAAAENAASHG